MKTQGHILHTVMMILRWFEILNIGEWDDEPKIRSAYKHLIRLTHPDKVIIISS